MTQVSIDRRVAFQVSGETVVLPLSQLRDKPYVVLLGEPGIGKTTALEYEASCEGGQVQTCREAITEQNLPNNQTAYLDALDEFRSGEDGKGKLLALAKVLKEASTTRWRLTCRAEDWRDVADLNAMRKAAAGQTITVATLLPLDSDEAAEILAGLGADDPDAIVREAASKGATAFLESPLSVALLYAALSSHGGWPETRYELFDRATNQLAWEHDAERVIDDRPGPDEIVQLAEKMCFYQLATGAMAIWRANAPPPGGISDEYVPIHALALDHSKARFTLDTALFRGEGHAFVPFHKTIAEYLGARYLARKVTGGLDGFRFPLNRARALITSHDGKAPSEMRGLFAWFAAHLSKLDDHVGAATLIELDAATVLAYGDAAVFRTDERRTILHNLDRDDPYFLSSSRGSTVLGGLAGADLIADFEGILDGRRDTHLQQTVLDALSDGEPLPGMEMSLHRLVLDASRPEWQRDRAVEAWIKIGTDRPARRLQLYRDLLSTEVNFDQIALRADLLAGLSTDVLTADMIRQLLTDFNELPTDEGDSHYMGSLHQLLDQLKKRPRADFFDHPGIAPPGENRGLKSEVRYFLQRSMASAIRASLDISANRLWAWLRGIREYEWDRLDDDLVAAISAWIDQYPSRRELELFEAIANAADPGDAPWVISSRYIPTTRRAPTAGLIETLLKLAVADPDQQRRRARLEIAAWAAKTDVLWPKLKDSILSALTAEGGMEELVATLLSDPNAEWKQKEKARQEAEDAELEKARISNVKDLASKVNGIAAAITSEHGVLWWAASHYRDASISNRLAPMQAVEKFTNPRISSAIAEGLVQYAVNVDTEITVAELGQMDAKNSSYKKEYVVAAGVHQAILQGREEELRDCSLVTAIIALRHRYFSDKTNASLETWAVERLAMDLQLGAEALVSFWTASIEAGGTSLDFLHHLSTSPELAARSLTLLLQNMPNLDKRLLLRALSHATSAISKVELLDLAAAALAGELRDDARAVWGFVQLALEPRVFGANHINGDLEAILLAPDTALADNLQEMSDEQDELDALRIRVLAPLHAAEDRDWIESDSISSVIRTAMKRLQASPAPEAVAILRDLSATVHPSWKTTIAHAIAEQARLMRDKLYIAPSVSKLNNALAGGPPANPADLIAIVREELDRYKRTLRTGSEMPWKRYWNTNENGAATNPKIENEDRDRLLELLRPQFERYGIVESAPEARMGENTRVDILLLSYAGKTLPIEIKRHTNSEIWTAPVEQLLGYAQTEGACDYGFYLVFWFGTECGVPARKDKKARPTSAAELETQLVADLPSNLKDMFMVMVLDVSRPDSMIEKQEKPRKTRTKKGTWSKSGGRRDSCFL